MEGKLLYRLRIIRGELVVTLPQIGERAQSLQEIVARYVRDWHYVQVLVELLEVLVEGLHLRREHAARTFHIGIRVRLRRILPFVVPGL